MKGKTADKAKREESRIISSSWNQEEKNKGIKKVQ